MLAHSVPTHFKIAAILLAIAAPVRAQVPQRTAAPITTGTPQLSPKAAYDDAMHPFDMTRRSIDNWSAAEVSALKVSIDRARAACQARDPHSFSGPELIDYARLCGLGQEWGTVVLTTTLYIDAPTPSKPLLTEAHAARVDADLRLHSEPDGLRDARTMLTVVAYSPLVAEASDEAIEYMRFSTPQDALAIATQRQPFILAQLKKLTATTPQQPAPPATVAISPAIPKAAGPPDVVQLPAASSFTIHELYNQGLALASLQQLANQPETAQESLAQLDGALPSVLAPDDSLPIAESRRRYALLGKPLPELAMRPSPSAPTDSVPAIPATNTMTVLLLFPDWCAQCITAMSNVPEAVFRVAGHEAFYYGLLAETVPERKPDSAIASSQIAANFSPAYAASLLSDKPVVKVSPATLNQFAATDFPFLILTDAKGIVRIAQPVDPDDLVSGGKVDAAVALVGQQWPQVVPKPAAPNGAVSTIGKR